MPKNNKNQKPLIRSNRTATMKNTMAATRKAYMGPRAKRPLKKTGVFTPCANANTYNRAWPPSTVGGTISRIEDHVAAGTAAKKEIEKLGDQGAKWYLCRQLLGRTIEDGDKTKPFMSGYFYSFSGARTLDSVYADPVSSKVYVIEAKGTKKGAAAHLLARDSKNVQGTTAYLLEVAADMKKAGGLKEQAADRILNAKPGQVIYIGVQTTYSVAPNGVVEAQEPRKIFTAKN